MIKHWKKGLHELGFRRAPEGRCTFARGEGFFRQMIWESPSRFEKGKVLIHLAVAVRDRFLRPPPYVIALVACLRADGAVIQDHGEGTWWGESEGEAAYAALLRHGVPWLEEYSDARRLSEYLERVLREGIRGVEPRDPVARLAARLLLPRVAGPALRRPPVYNYFLSLIHDEAGDTAAARATAERWLVHPAHLNAPGEPERTARHLAELDRAAE